MDSTASRRAEDDGRAPVEPVVLIGPRSDRVAPYADRLRCRGLDVEGFTDAPAAGCLRSAAWVLFLDWGWEQRRRSQRAAIVAALVEARGVRILRVCNPAEADRAVERPLP